MVAATAFQRRLDDESPSADDAPVEK